MIKLYSVQTFYGTRAKTFQRRHHAEEYYRKLCSECECVDPIHEFYVTQHDFCYTDIED